MDQIAPAKVCYSIRPMNSLKHICVFCGSSRGLRPEYAEAVRAGAVMPE